MDHIRLSPRLQMVADFVPPCTCAADIGTDHGYLPVWLLQNGIAETAIATQDRSQMRASLPTLTT